MYVMHSYTFEHYAIERALRKAKAYGYDAVELSPCHWGWSQAEMLAHLDESLAKAEQIGIPIRVVDFSGLFVDPDPATREQALANFGGLLDRVKGRGIARVNGGLGRILSDDPNDWNRNGSAAADEGHWERGLDSLKRMGEMAERAEVQLCLEIHMNTLHDTAATTLRLLEGVDSPWVKATLDTGNMHPIQRAETPAEAVRMLGKHLGYAHLKNCHMVAGKADYNVYLGEGDIDHFTVAQALVEVGYQGDICIEYCGLGDGSLRADADLRYLKGIMAEAREGA